MWNGYCKNDSPQIYFAYNIYKNNTTYLKFIDTLIRDKLK